MQQARPGRLTVALILGHRWITQGETRHNVAGAFFATEYNLSPSHFGSTNIGPLCMKRALTSTLSVGIKLHAKW